MATILLQAAGTFLGGFLGPVGSAIGSAVGSLAGYAVDTAIINGTRRIEGPRLTSARAFSAEEGASIPRVYGTARLGGIVIWATRFEEAKTTRRQGGKGGPKVTEYDYSANVAFALCEGEIAGIRRVWADGREVDLTTIEMRVHRGTADQAPDPLIAAKQGAANTPAYRGLAYVVFDRLPLGEYGNRVPQLQFEVLRPVGDLRSKIRAVCLIPGSTEYGLDPALVTRSDRPGETRAENRHVLHGPTDLVASLDELQKLCPNLESIALVVSWFGDDLRAGQCRIKPCVTTATFMGFSKPWIVSGVERADAKVVSYYGGGSAYGGTPTDRSVMDAIAEIKARGLKVTLYPFVMMDVPHGNTLPDPYGGAAQVAYPWRGRITCFPAPGRPGTTDKTASARAQVQAFAGSAAPGDFTAAADTIGFGGTPADWGYRRLVLHYAHLAIAAGGVDAFLIGSELRGLSTLRDGANAFPFVETLCSLADQCAALLGPATKITYGADWSEYFGYQPPDGSGDVFHHLDPLWARASIGAVGIDNYMPLSDWRDADYQAGNPDGSSGPYDPRTLRASIDSGEGFDWYYASFADRETRLRTPITDGGYGKPWVFRYKDIVSWWSNVHRNRIAGVEQPAATAWVPQAKPIWLTEIGCPAVDKGTNQPNVFVDPKSSESFTPYSSNDGRSDLAPKRYLDAHMAHWDPASPTFVGAANPVSASYGGRMVDHERTYVWCWDARPFPAFPLRSDVWADGANWHLGHWLNGRLEGSDIGALINAILHDHGLPEADVSEADGTALGYVVDDPASARSSLEAIVDLFDLAVREEPDGLVCRSSRGRSAQPQAIDVMVLGDAGAALDKERLPDHELPAELVLNFRDLMAEFQTGTARSVRAGVQGRRRQSASFPGNLEREQAKVLVADWHRRLWAARESIALSVASYREGIEPGAVITLPAESASEFLVTDVEDGLVRRLKARRIERGSPAAWKPGLPDPGNAPAIPVGKPYVQFLDLPSRTASAVPQDQFRIAVWRKPWKSMAVLASPEATGFTVRATVESPADLGTLAQALMPGKVEGRIDRSSALVVDLYDAEAASVSRTQLLNGANVLAVKSAAGSWEILQFETAEEIAPGRWRLSSLLRGQLGTNDAMASGAATGAAVVVLDERVEPAGLLSSESGLERFWKVGPSGSEISSANFAALTQTGGVRAKLPLSPVHLRRKAVGGALDFRWIRRSRVDADDWAPSDVPLGEDREQYRIQVAAAGGPIVRTAVVNAPQWIYAAPDIVTDFGGLPAAIDVAVQQLSVTVGWGVACARRFPL